MFLVFAFIPWVYAAFVGITSFFVKYLVVKTATRLAVFVTIIAITTAFTLAIHSLLLLIVVASPVGNFAVGLSLLPSNTEVCIASYFSAYVLRFVYDYATGFAARWVDAGL